MTGFFRAAATFGGALLAAAVLLALLDSSSARLAAAPPAAFTMSLTNPVVGQGVLFSDETPGSPPDRIWDFGDGTGSTAVNPTHAYAAPGSYVVRLTAGGGSAESGLIVSPETTLRLIASHSFEVTVTAFDPRTGIGSSARAIPQSEIFGYFSFPELTGNPDNPEVFVKILDATPIGQTYWVFYGGLTSLAYSLTVRETATGRVRIYEKEGGTACGGFDTSGFPELSPTATPTQSAPPSSSPVRSATPTRRATAPATPTSTLSPPPPTTTPTATLTATATPSPSPTVPPVTVVRLRGIPWQWDFYAPGVVGGSSITLKKGQTYEFHIYDDAPDDSLPHAFSGVAAIGLDGVNPLSPGAPDVIQLVTPQTVGTFPFLCTESSCGIGHDGMHGTIEVVP